MPVISTKELSRTFEREITRSAIVKRRWVCVLSDNTTQGTGATFAEVTEATGTTQFGVAHPDPALASWKLRKVWMNEGFEGSPYHVEVIAEYGTVRDEEILHPTSRPAQWSVESSPGEVPALFYYDGATQRPLTNSAYDYFPGLTTEEAVARITIKRNFPSFPTAWIQTMNKVNNASYFGMPTHTAKVVSVTTSQAYEEFGGQMVKFWDTTATIAYRESGHNLQLPDVGYNFIEGGEKRRAMVFDFENSEWIPSPSPIGLNGSGLPSPTGHAAVLDRRVSPEISFSVFDPTPQ